VDDIGSKYGDEYGSECNYLKFDLFLFEEVCSKNNVIISSLEPLKQILLA